MAGVAPIAWAAKKNALHAWAADQLAIAGDWAKQDAPALPYPFFLLDIIAGPLIVHHDRRARANAGDGLVREYIVGDRTATLSVEVLVSFEGVAHNHDTDAMARAALLQSSLARPEVMGALGAVGLGILDVGPVQDRRTPVEAGWISRAGFDVTVHLVSLIDPGSVPAVETLEVTAGTGSAADFDAAEMGLPSLVMRFCGEQRVTAPAATAVATPGTFLKIAGTYAAGEALDFDLATSGRLIYTGTEPRKVKASIAGALTAASPVNVKAGLAKNGAQPTQFTEVRVSSDRVGVAFEDLIELSPNDYLEAWLTADGAVNVTAQTLSLIAIA